MKTLHHLQVLALCAIMAIGINAPVYARIKCWMNKDGFRECGDHVPPEYIQQGHLELNKQGLVVEEQERAKTDEELEEEARLAAIEAEKKRKQEEKELLDRILTESYTSVADIELSREEHISVIESTIQLTIKRNEKIQEDLDKRMKVAAAAERRGKTPDETLLKEIESLRRQLGNNEKFIQERREEQERVTEDFRVKIDRFKELVGIED